MLIFIRRGYIKLYEEILFFPLKRLNAAEYPPDGAGDAKESFTYA